MKGFTEWIDGYDNKKSPHTPSKGVGSHIRRRLNEEYEDGDILHFWFLCNQSSPAVQKFTCGLYELLKECFPDEYKVVDTTESELSPLVCRHIAVRHGDAI